MIDANDPMSGQCANRGEVLGGQSWSLITPGRSGISPLPGNVFYTDNIDVNYQLGLVWGRIPEFRFVEVYGEQIFLPVRVNDGKTAWFLLDTGANETVISKGLAEETRLTFQGEMGTEGAVASTGVGMAKMSFCIFRAWKFPRIPWRLWIFHRKRSWVARLMEC